MRIRRSNFSSKATPTTTQIMTESSERDNESDRYELGRFVDAQTDSYDRALAELRRGRKRSHWMWYIFPQIEGLGRSTTARFFSIKSAAEAEAYLRHPILGSRLNACADAVLAAEGRSAHDIFGFPDVLKLRSCMTLFAHLSSDGSVFHQVLEKYFQGQPDEETLRILKR